MRPQKRKSSGSPRGLSLQPDHSDQGENFKVVFVEQKSCPICPDGLASAGTRNRGATVVITRNNHFSLKFATPLRLKGELSSAFARKKWMQ